MTSSPEADKAARLSAVAALIEQRVEHGERSGLLTFAASYFQRVDPEDIAARDVEDLYGALLSHWQFAQRREPTKPKIRVLNPAAGEHGWSSRHTVIERKAVGNTASPHFHHCPFNGTLSYVHCRCPSITGGTTADHPSLFRSRSHLSPLPV